MRDGPVVAYERRRVLPESHGYGEKVPLRPPRHLHVPQHVEADEQQLDDARLDAPDVHCVNAPGVPQPFARGSHVGRLLAGGEAEPYPEPRRGRANQTATGRDRAHLATSGRPDCKRPQTGRLNREPARIHGGAVRDQQPRRRGGQADHGPVDRGVSLSGVSHPTNGRKRSPEFGERHKVSHGISPPARPGTRWERPQSHGRRCRDEPGC